MIIEDKEMKRILRAVPKEDKGLDDWIREACVAPAYIIYNSRTDEAVCTRCGSTNLCGSEYTGMHGIKTRCPECGEEVIALAEEYGRDGRSDWFRLLTWTRKGRTVYGRLYEIEASFREPGPPRLHKWLSALYVVNAKERHYYKHKPAYCWGEDHWEEYKTFRVPAPAGGMGYCWTTKYTFTYMKTVGLRDVFLKSDLRYLWIPGWCENMPPEEMTQYIGFGMRQQSIELMTKAGFTNLVMERIKGARSGLIVNWQGRSLERILKQPKRNVRKLQLLNPTTREMRLFQKLTEEERDIVTPEMIRAMDDSVRYGDLENLRKKIEELAPFKKWLKYMTGQITDKVHIIDWFDYIDACKKMGIDIHKNRILFPENLKEAHDIQIAQLAAREDAAKTAAIKAAARCEEFRSDPMIMLPAN